MGFFTSPTTDELTHAFDSSLDGERVESFVIGQRQGGRAAVVATPTRVLVLTVSMFKLKATGVVDAVPLAEAEVKRSGLKLSVGKHSVKLGLADNGRAAALADFVNSH